MRELKAYVLYVNAAALIVSVLAGFMNWVTKDGYSTFWAVSIGAVSIPMVLYLSIRYCLNNAGWRGYFSSLVIPGAYVVFLAVLNLVMSTMFWSGGEASWSAMYLWAAIALAVAVILLSNLIIRLVRR